jgi:hypothetical protein
MIESGKPQNVKSSGYKLLSEIAEDQLARKRVPDELVADLEEGADDASMRNILSTLVKYKDGLTPDVRSRLSQFLKEKHENAVIKEFASQFDIRE